MSWRNWPMFDLWRSSCLSMSALMMAAVPMRSSRERVFQGNQDMPARLNLPDSDWKKKCNQNIQRILHEIWLVVELFGQQQQHKLASSSLLTTYIQLSRLLNLAQVRLICLRIDLMHTWWHFRPDIRMCDVSIDRNRCHSSKVQSGTDYFVQNIRVFAIIVQINTGANLFPSQQRTFKIAFLDFISW